MAVIIWAYIATDQLRKVSAVCSDLYELFCFIFLRQEIPKPYCTRHYSKATARVW